MQNEQREEARKMTSAMLPTDVLKALKIEAIKSDRTQADIIAEALRLYLAVPQSTTN